LLQSIENEKFNFIFYYFSIADTWIPDVRLKNWSRKPKNREGTSKRKHWTPFNIIRTTTTLDLWLVVVTVMHSVWQVTKHTRMSLSRRPNYYPPASTQSQVWYNLGMPTLKKNGRIRSWSARADRITGLRQMKNGFFILKHAVSSLPDYYFPETLKRKKDLEYRYN